uniref:Uncharacterized protein n=1 Tax=Knipowitschia caucasica TaxID=637954 RepID=A0AAV2MGN3_KNICA
MAAAAQGPGWRGGDQMAPEFGMPGGRRFRRGPGEGFFSFPVDAWENEEGSVPTAKNEVLAAPRQQLQFVQGFGAERRVNDRAASTCACATIESSQFNLSV